MINKNNFCSWFVDYRGPYDIEGIPLKLYILLAALSITMLEIGLLVDAGVAGSFAVLWTIGFFFFALGERIRILKFLLGGGLVVSYGGAAIVAQAGFVSASEIQHLQSQIMGNKFLYFFLASLVSTSILSLSPSTLLKSLIAYAPIIFGALAVSALAGVCVGWAVGLSVEKVVTMYFLPIMGGGAGAGVVPMSEIYADVTQTDSSEYFGYALAALTLGNISAILVASALNKIGNIYPALSGDGKLVKGEAEKYSRSIEVDDKSRNTHSAMVLIVCILIAGTLLYSAVRAVHLFAWIAIISIALSFSGLISDVMKVSMRALTEWGMKAFLVTIMVAFGFSADLEVIAKIFSITSVAVIVSIVVGAALGAGAMAYMFKCYPIEGSIAGGLCMANAGGAGDLQVLSAAGRMALYPYAQISSRVGGAVVLLLAAYLFSVFLV